MPGGGAFVTHSLAPDLKVGFSVAGNFGSILDYDDNWVGRYRVQQATILGVSFVPSIAYRVNDKLSLGAGVNAMYGIFKQQVAINNVLPARPMAGSSSTTTHGAGAPTWASCTRSRPRPVSA